MKDEYVFNMELENRNPVNAEENVVRKFCFCWHFIYLNVYHYQDICVYLFIIVLSLQFS